MTLQLYHARYDGSQALSFLMQVPHGSTDAELQHSWSGPCHPLQVHCKVLDLAPGVLGLGPPDMTETCRVSRVGTEIARQLEIR